ncbi:MAG: DUF1476 domain-containing protein [Hyphomicrobiales bacterium]
MNAFNKCGERYERGFVHDEDMKFKATARRDRLLGLWATEKLGLSGPRAQDYARSLVQISLERQGDEEIFSKLRKDFDDKAVTLSDHRVRRTMDELLQTALEQVRNGS